MNIRLGCVCCPLQGQRKLQKDFEEHPKFVREYIKRGIRIERKRLAVRKSLELSMTYFTIMCFAEVIKIILKRNKLFLEKWIVRNF